MIPAHEEALAKLLGEEPILTIELDIPQPVRPQFYAHINKETQSIVAIAPTALDELANSDVISIPIEYELAEKFLTGKENVVRWMALPKDDKYTLISEVEFQREKSARVDEIQAFELTQPPEKVPYPDVIVEVGDPSVVLIHYNGETVQRWAKPAKLFFTAEGDPGHLKCAFTIDVNTLNEILRENELSEWPNPIALNLQNADDISVYSIRSGIKMAIKRNEASNN